ncbi:hypothetical protein MSL71_37210 [Desulfoluna butyratoxydans]|uniref:Uncharacterized protein n=1 Tax=Desulfoluna butyratoxydans TaxID=231438 RepID=A0A4V6ILQ8_9BACT|nr:hypothetical protein MSL71_37210 [Desulfoluna butyratoxydans]
MYSNSQTGADNKQDKTDNKKEMFSKTATPRDIKMPHNPLKICVKYFIKNVLTFC